MTKKATFPLGTVQKWMQELLLNPYKTAQETKELSVDTIVKSSKRLNAESHLAIYQRSYIARLRDCMSKQFTALEYALGEDLFIAFADEYLHHYPSKNYNLIALGKNFAEYLEATRPDKDQVIKEEWPDFMIELAQFEYAINIIFEEKAEEDYKLVTSNINDESLQLIPVCYPFQFQFPIRAYYTDFANDLKPELPFAKPTFCVILRHEYQLTFQDINIGQYYFLTYLKEGFSIPQVKDKLIKKHNVSLEQINEFWPIWKEQWIKKGFFRK
ncbi:MAG: DNA-binding domain-containing protein [Flavobacteriaceae bacterium]|nr:DNA-binding domain-containing protein [Flavobacteriaceae bacterium]